MIYNLYTSRVNYYVLSEINMLKVEDRTKLLRLNHVLFYSMCLLISTLINIFRAAKSHSHRTRASLYNCIVSSTMGCDSHTFYYNAILDWNNLPDDMKSITKKNINFSICCKKALLMISRLILLMLLTLHPGIWMIF